MKYLFSIALMLGIFSICKSQDKILAIGYAKNFVNKDSSNVSFTVDLNRVPGKTESGGSYYIVNTAIGKTPLDFYLKPTADVNLGTYTTSAPNNISAGLPLGVSYEFNTNKNFGYLALSGEFSSDGVAEKKLDQYLYYFSPGIILNYTFYDTSKFQNLIDFAIGGYYSFGTRLQNVKTKIKNAYNKFYVPISLSMSLLKNKTFYRIKLSSIYKYNYILNDDQIITPDKNRNFFLFKLDYYFIKQLGFNLTYNNGYEEPLFKKVHSLSFGITLAR